MGQKVNPTGFRIGIVEPWRSRWYASKKEFGDLLIEDYKIRNFVKTKYQFAGIPKIEIERTRDQVVVHLYTARPGIIIGRKGQEVDRLKAELEDLTGRRMELKIVEINNPHRSRRARRRGCCPAAHEARQLPTDDQAHPRPGDGRGRARREG